MQKKKCSQCSEIIDTLQSLQCCDGVRNQTICMRQLGGWLQRHLKRNDACQEAVRKCIGILATFACGQEANSDDVLHCLPFANSVQTVAIHTLEHYDFLKPSISSWLKIMKCCQKDGEELSAEFQASEIVMGKFGQLLQKIVRYVKHQSPQADTFQLVSSRYFGTNFCSPFLRFEPDTTHYQPLQGTDIRFISIVLYEFSSRSLILYPLYRKEDTVDSMRQQDFSLYENECCMLWFCFVILSLDVLHEYDALFCEESIQSIRLRFLMETSLPDADNCIENTMKLLRNCLWMLSNHSELRIDAIMNFIKRNSEVEMILRAISIQLQRFLNQEKSRRDAVLAASFSWVWLQFLLWQNENEEQGSLKTEKDFDIRGKFDVWMKSNLPNFSKLSLCVAVIEYCSCMRKDSMKLSSETTLGKVTDEFAVLLLSIFRTLIWFCHLREDSHFHFMALDALRRCILKLIESSLMTAELIRQVLQVIWQRCQEPIRGVSNQVSSIIQDLLSSHARVDETEQQRMKLFWEEFYHSLVSGVIGTKAQFVIIESLLSFMGGSTHLLELAPNFPRQALLALSRDQSCSTSAAHCLETFWRLLLQEIGEHRFIDKTRYDLLESIMEAKSTLEEERLMSQALVVYLKLARDRTQCLVSLLNGISSVTRDYWQATRLKWIILCNGRNLCPGLRLCYMEHDSHCTVSDRESTVEIFLEELNLSLSSQDETCRFAVIECITGASFQSAQLEMHLLPRLIPWFLFESKPSANWRFLHLISGWLKRLEQNIHSSIHEKQTLLHDWERNMFQKKESMKSIPEMNVYPLQLADLEEQIYRHFLYNMITFEVNSFRQHNASTLLNQWMFVCLEKESILSHVSRKLTQQLLYSCYISMLNGSEKLVKSVSKFLDIQKLSSPDTLSSLDWIWKVSFRHLSSIRSSHAECGAQIIRILFKNYVISMGYYLTAWKNDDSVTSEQLDFGMTQFRITDPALASFYFFSWFLSNIKAKFSSSIVVFSELNEEEWLFGHFIAYKHLFQDGWRLEQWLNFYSLEDIRTNILNPLMDILSIYIMESLKGVGYMEPWIGVYLHSIASSSTTESSENDSSFQRKLIVGSFHCLKEICSLISAIIQTVCGHDVADAGNNRKPQPSYVTKGLRRNWNNTNIPNQIWTVQDIEYLFSLQIEVICCTTHSGVMECVGDSILQTSSALFRSSQLELSELPRKKLFQVLTELSNARFYSLRRSAGLPYFVRAVCLAAEQARWKEITPRVLQLLSGRLERFVDEDNAGSFASGNTTPMASLDASVIHCMNILQFLLQDASLSDVTMNFAETSFIRARKAYASSEWSIRNSAMLLAGAALRRILKISGEAREREYSQFVLPIDSIVLPSVQVENETRLTFGELFGKLFPNLFSHISVCLRQVQRELLQNDFDAKSDCVVSIYPILCLLSTLRNSNGNSLLFTIKDNLEKTKQIWNLSQRPPHPFCSSHEMELLPSLIEMLVDFLQVRQQYIRFAAGTCLCRMVRGTPWSLKLWISLLESLPLIPINCLQNSNGLVDSVAGNRISYNVIKLKRANPQQSTWNWGSLQVDYSSLSINNKEDNVDKQLTISFLPKLGTEEPEIVLHSVTNVHLALPNWSRCCQIQWHLPNNQIMDITYDNEQVVFDYNKNAVFPCDFQVISLSSIQNMLQGNLFTCIKLLQENILYWTETLSSQSWLDFLVDFVFPYLSWIAVSTSIPPLTRSMWFTWMSQLLKVLKENETIQSHETASKLNIQIHENAIYWISQVLFGEYQNSKSLADGLRFGQTQLVIECLKLLETMDQQLLFSLEFSSLLSSLSMKDAHICKAAELFDRLPALLENSCLHVQRVIVGIFENWTKSFLSTSSLDNDSFSNALKQLGTWLERILTNSTSPNDILAVALHYFRSLFAHLLSFDETDSVNLYPSKFFLACMSSSLQNWDCKTEFEFTSFVLARTKQIIEQNTSYTVLEEAFPLFAVTLQFQYRCYAKKLIPNHSREQMTIFRNVWYKNVEFFLNYIETDPHVHPVPFRMAMLDSLDSLGRVLFKELCGKVQLESFDHFNEVDCDFKSCLKNIWARFSLCIMEFLQDEYSDVRNRASKSLYDILKEKYEFPAYSPNWFQAVDWVFKKCFSLEFIMLDDERNGWVLCYPLVSFIRKIICLSFQVNENSLAYIAELEMSEICPCNVIEKVLSQWHDYFHSTSIELFDCDPTNSFKEPLLQMQHLARLCRTILLSIYGKSYQIWRRRLFEISVKRLCFLLDWVFYSEKREMIGFLPEFFRPLYILLLHLYILDEGHDTYLNCEGDIESAIQHLQKLSKFNALQTKLHKILTDHLDSFLDWHFQNCLESPKELLFLIGKTF